MKLTDKYLQPLWGEWVKRSKRYQLKCDAFCEFTARIFPNLLTNTHYSTSSFVCQRRQCSNVIATRGSADFNFTHCGKRRIADTRRHGRMLNSPKVSHFPDKWAYDSRLHSSGSSCQMETENSTQADANKLSHTCQIIEANPKWSMLEKDPKRSLNDRDAWYWRTCILLDKYAEYERQSTHIHTRHVGISLK